MAYLEPSEYLAYGLSAETADTWVAAASAMIDAYCRRGSLLSTSYTERLHLNVRSGTAQLTYGPVQQVTAVRARYARRREYEQGSLLEMALVFGLPDQWTTIDPSIVTVDAACGELQLPLSVFGLPFSEVEVSYNAGLAAVSDPVKWACAQVVKNAQATPGLNVRSSKLDTLQTEYFSDSLLDVQVQMMLRPFVAERLG